MANMARKGMRPNLAGSVLRCFVAGCAALSLTSCGILIGAQHSCESTFGLTEPKKVSCTGSVDTLRGSPSLSIVQIGEDLDGASRSVPRGARTGLQGRDRSCRLEVAAISLP